MVEEIKHVFFFLTHRGFTIIKESDTNYFASVIYKRGSLAIYISTDTKENIIRVYVMKLDDDRLPHIDDSEKVFLLEKLNKKYLSLLNGKSFEDANKKFSPLTGNKELIKQAKELYLILEFII